MKKFNLKNYTSEVSPAKSAERIEQFLVKAGAEGIQKRYQNGELVGIDFIMEVEQPFGRLAFRVPIKPDEATKYILSQKQRPTKASYRAAKIQGAQTAWRIAQDWLEVSLSMVALKQIEMTQALFPYIVNREGRTLYEIMKEGGFRQLMASNNHEDDIVEGDTQE